MRNLGTARRCSFVLSLILAGALATTTSLAGDEAEAPRPDLKRAPDVVEVEPNDTVQSASSLAGTDVVAKGNAYREGGSANAPDVDYWSFAGNAKDRVLVAMQDSFGNIGSSDGELTLLRQDGRTIVKLDADGDNGGSFSSAILPATEIYYVKVSHFTQTGRTGEVLPYFLHFRQVEAAPIVALDSATDGPAAQAKWLEKQAPKADVEAEEMETAEDSGSLAITLSATMRSSSASQSSGTSMGSGKIGRAHV